MACVGIDFGRSTCMVATYSSAGPCVLEDERGNEIIDSYVGIDPKTNKVVVGEKVKSMAQSNPDNAVEQIRRLMGEDTKIAFGAGATADQVLSPEEVAAHLFRYLKRSAETHLEEEVDRCVITVPANFPDAARRATRQAGEIAGMTVDRILSDPAAAVRAYSYDKEVKKEHVIVCDLSKGTFEVSIVKRRGDALDVEASSGDKNLGGKDFNEALLRHVAEKFEDKHGISIEPGSDNYYRLLFACEKARKELSSNRWTSTQVPLFAQAKKGGCVDLDVDVTRSTFEDLISDKIDRMGALIEKVLEDMELAPSEIGRVILTGGSTQVPYVQDRMEEVIGQPPRQEIDPDKTVALGAAVQGKIIDGERDTLDPSAEIVKTGDQVPASPSANAQEAVEQADQGWRASEYFENVKPLLEVVEDELSAGVDSKRDEQLRSLIEEMKGALSSGREEQVEELKADITDILFEIRG